MTFNSEHPWLPADAETDESFDPLAHFEAEVDEETPMVITPRGGGREVGRSCYQVTTRNGDYLVDCGLNQGSGGQFPDFRGIELESIDAVFLTHAHIDHCGGLPVLENRGLLDDDAPIITTPPTTQIAHTLLEDSLKIHKRETQSSPKGQQFTKADVEAVYDRFTPVEYGKYRLRDIADNDDETLTFQLGDAAHLLGSAWVAMQVDGYSTVFSGDLGGRATHLRDIDTPPKADQLVIESTYGDRHSHTSYSDAETDMFSEIRHAVEHGNPVLIPTFAVGRTQALLVMLSNRLHTLSDNLSNNVRVVVDGMAKEATNIYQTHTDDNTYFSDSIVNQIKNGQQNVIEPASVEYPQSDKDRRRILNEFSPETSENVPIIISPSGMLTGGHSPRYLTEFVSRYDEAKIFLTGYQAKNTGGRAIQNAIEAGEDEATVEFDTDPFEADWKPSDRVVWRTTDRGNQVVRAKLPTDWVEKVSGLSGHGAQATLLRYTRDVQPETITLVHGPPYAQENLASHLLDNVETAKEVARARLLTPIEVTHNPNLNTASLSEEMVSNPGHQDFEDQIDTINESLAMLNETISELKQNAITDESQLRVLIQDILNEDE